MKWILDTIGMTIGGAIGWAIGAPISIFTAFMISMVGTGAGLYVTRRFTKSMLG